MSIVNICEHLVGIGWRITQFRQVEDGHELGQDEFRCTQIFQLQLGEDKGEKGGYGGEGFG